MIDAHAHLTDRRFADDLVAVLDRARKTGVTRILTAAEDARSSEAAVALAARHDAIRVAVGVHPHRAVEWREDVLARLMELARDERVVAIGEIGLDFSGRSAPVQEQERAFRAQLGLAALLGLPVVLHVRDAGDRVREILGESAELTGMVHCFSEDAAAAERWVELGFHISFAGTLTYPGSDRLRAAATRVPTERLLAETDSPYLAPQNVRGSRNEPVYVAAVHAALAHLRSADLGALVAAIEGNALRLFGSRWEPSLPA